MNTGNKTRFEFSNNKSGFFSNIKTEVYILKVPLEKCSPMFISTYPRTTDTMVSILL